MKCLHGAIIRTGQLRLFARLLHKLGGGTTIIAASFSQDVSADLLSWHRFFLHIVSVFGNINIENHIVLLTFFPALGDHHSAARTLILDLEYCVLWSFISKEIVRRLDLVLLSHNLHQKSHILFPGSCRLTLMIRLKILNDLSPWLLILGWGLVLFLFAPFIHKLRISCLCLHGFKGLLGLLLNCGFRILEHIFVPVLEMIYSPPLLGRLRFLAAPCSALIFVYYLVHSLSRFVDHHSAKSSFFIYLNIFNSSNWKHFWF